MSTAVPSVSIVSPSPLVRAAGWYRDAFRLWRRAPFRLIALSLALLVAEAIVQLVPVVGTVLSKAIVPMLGVGLWIGLDQLDRGQPLRFACLWAGWGHPRRWSLLGMMAMLGFTAFVLQVACAAAAYGPAVWDGVVLGHMRSHPQLLTRELEYVLMLPGLVISTLLSLAPPLFLFHGETVPAAITGSLRLILRRGVAVTLAVVPQLALFAASLSSPWLMPLLLLLMPLGTVVGFAMWRDLADRPQAH